MVLRDLESLELASVMELERGCVLGTLVHDHELVQVGISATTVDAHRELPDARLRILYPD